MEITSGKIASAKKVVIYAPEGIGKSTFASHFPRAIFIDVEGSTKELDVARTNPRPSSWTMLFEQIRYFINNPHTLGTLIIDTIDWAEKLCIESVCSKAGKSGIEDFGYGKGPTYVVEEYGKILNLLTELIDRNVNVVLVAHASTRKFDLPEESGSFDKWELKLTKFSGPLTKEWADMILFVNYKTFVVKVGEGTSARNKAQGTGKRVMYTSHRPTFDAKNRYELPEEVEFNYSSIAHIIPDLSSNTANNTPALDSNKVHTETDKQKQVSQIPAAPVQTTKNEVNNSMPVQQEKPTIKGDLSHLPKALSDLMTANGVTANEVQAAVAKRGYYPMDTPITNYEQKFIDGVLVAAWSKVYQVVLDIRGGK